jgi:hemolysin D
MRPRQRTALVKPPRRTSLEREFLPAALEIIDTPPSPAGRYLSLVIIAMTAAAIAWSCIGKIDIVTSAPGRIVARGKTKIIQPVETGQVTAIRVADGDHVKAGDVLIELNATEAAADQGRFSRDLLRAGLALARLQGLAQEILHPTTDGKAQLIDPPSDAGETDLAVAHAAMLAQLSQQNAKLADIDQQIIAKDAEAAQAQATLDKVQATLPMVAAQEEIRRNLKDREFGNKLAWYQANQQLIEQSHGVPIEARGKEAALATANGLRQERVALTAEFQVDVFEDLDKTREQVSALQAELAKAKERVTQATLRAPIAGTVQQLAVHTIGGVVTPAEPLLAIVPDRAGLVVEAMVQNKDVGFVHAGQAVRVKIDAFDFTRYGLIDGTVLDVTRDAMSQSDIQRNGQKEKSDGITDGPGTGAQEASAYLAHIALKTDEIGTEAGVAQLGPGMQVSAEIQTGERRVISYLLSPLVRHADESLRER